MSIPSKLDRTSLKGAARTAYKLCNPEGESWDSLDDRAQMRWIVVASETILTYFNKGKDLNDSCC